MSDNASLVIPLAKPADSTHLRKKRGRPLISAGPLILTLIFLSVVALILHEYYLLNHHQSNPHRGDHLWPTLAQRCQAHKPDPFQPQHIELQITPDQFPSLFKAYIHNHALQRECLLDPKCKNPPILVWRCPTATEAMRCAGLGDRFRGIQFALLMAILTNRLFLIDWSVAPYPLQNSLSPALINWIVPETIRVPELPHLNWEYCESPECPPQLEARVKDTGILTAPDFGRPLVNLSTDNLAFALKNYSNLAVSVRFPPPTLKNFTANPYYARLLAPIAKPGTDLMPLQRHLVRMLYTPSHNLTNRICQSPLANETKYFSVHIRAGVDVDETRSHRFGDMSSSPLLLVDALIKCMRTRAWLSQYPIFVASDSADIKSLFIDKARKANFTVYGTPIQKALHIGRVDKVSFSEQQYNTIFEDLMFLAGSEEIIMTGSGFARRAVALGKVKAIFQETTSPFYQRHCYKLWPTRYYTL